jgi:hypothetical protein
MRFRGTLILLLLVLGLGTSVWYLSEVRNLPSRDERRKLSLRLFDFKAGEIKSVEVVKTDQSVLFEKLDQKWWIRTPIQVRADPYQIQQVLSILEFLPRKRELSPEEISESKLTLADYGLDKPRMTARFKTSQDRAHVLHIGNERKQGNDLYVQVEGEPSVLVIDKEILDRLNKKLDDFRERALLDIPVDSVTRVEILQGTKSMEFEKQSDGSWRVVQPLLARADAARIGDLLAQICNARVDQFLSEDAGAAKTYGLDEPHGSVLKLTAGDQTYSIIFGDNLKEDPEKIAAQLKGRYSIVSIPSFFAKPVSEPLNYYRDASLASFDPASVIEVEVRQRQAVTLLRKDAEGWKILKPEVMEADPELVAEFLESLRATRISGFVSDVATELEKYSLKTPLYSIAIRGGAGEVDGAILELALGSQEPGSKLVHAKREGDSSVYALDLDQIESWPKHAHDFRTRTLFKIQKEQVLKCVQKRRGKAHPAFTMVRSPGGGFSPGEDTEGVLNETAWLQLLNTLQFFEVTKIVGTGLNSTAKQYGLDQPLLTIQAEYEKDGQPQSLELVVGRDNPQKRPFILWKDELLICEISPELYKILTASWFTRPSAK